VAPACELIEDIDAEDMTSGPEQKSKLSVVDVLENSEAERSWTGLITGKGSALMNGTKAGRSAGGVGGLDCRDSGVSGMVDGGNTGVGGIVREGKGRSSFVEVAGFTDGFASGGGDGQPGWLQSRGAICRRAFLGAGMGVNMLFAERERLEGLSTASIDDCDVVVGDAILCGVQKNTMYL